MIPSDTPLILGQLAGSVHFTIKGLSALDVIGQLHKGFGTLEVQGESSEKELGEEGGPSFRNCAIFLTKKSFALTAKPNLATVDCEV